MSELFYFDTYQRDEKYTYEMRDVSGTYCGDGIICFQYTQFDIIC